MALSGSSLGSMMAVAASTNSSAITTVIGTVSATSPTLTIVSTTPSSSPSLTSSPTTFQVSFDRSLQTFQLSNNDFDLVHVAADGSTSPMLPGEPVLVESIDPDGSRIDLTLSRPLAQGHYQLVVDPNTQLTGLDGSLLAATTPGSTLSDFTITPPVSSTASAIDIQTLGATETVIAGQLPTASDPNAVQYYKFEVATGHHWLVGLEISAHRDGGTLDSSLSLLDAQGHLISTADQGLSSDPNDPFLFAGLDPGTYYVEISARPDPAAIPGVGQPTGSGTVPNASAGAFRLHAVASVADQATQVLGLRLDHADSLSTSPTGLTLEFSGGLSPTGITGTAGLTLVDSSGATWSLTPTNYDPADGQLSLAFDRPLAPGTYTVELASPAGLLDLAGKVPVAKGLPSGIFGSFKVTPSEPIAGDLGVASPGLGAAGLASTAMVTPGSPTTERFVVVEPGVYALAGINLDTGLQYSIEDGTGRVLMAGPDLSPTVGAVGYLAPGAYEVVLTTSNPAVTQASFAIVQRLNEHSSLLDSAVSQGPALNLRLVSPQADFGQGSSASTTPTASSIAPIVAAPASPSAGGETLTSLAGRPGALAAGRSTPAGVSANDGPSTPVGPSVFGLFLGSGPMGRPSTESSQMGIVGPSVASGSPGIASNSRDLIPSLFSPSVGTGGDRASEPDMPRPDRRFKGEVVPASPGEPTLEAGLLIQSADSLLKDDRSLAQVDWIGQMVDVAMVWLDRTDSEENNLAKEASRLLVASEIPPTEEVQIESASVASPLGVGIFLGVIAVGSHRKFFGAKTGPAKAAPKSRLQPLLAGPHRRIRAGVHRS